MKQCKKDLLLSMILPKKVQNQLVKMRRKFAERFKDEKVIYVMSSGATHEVAYSTSICLMMEMQWINSGTFHSGEFFTDHSKLWIKTYRLYY